MTGSVTFNFDTTGYTGSFLFGIAGNATITAFQLTSGIYTATSFSLASLSLNSGELSVLASSPVADACGTVTLRGCAMSSGN
jgi:hypothetical protein